MAILPRNRDKDVRIVRVQLFRREIKGQSFLRVQFSIENRTLRDELIRRLSRTDLGYSNWRRQEREDEKGECGSHEKS